MPPSQLVPFQNATRDFHKSRVEHHAGHPFTMDEWKAATEGTSHMEQRVRVSRRQAQRADLNRIRALEALVEAGTLPGHNEYVKTIIAAARQAVERSQDPAWLLGRNPCDGCNRLCLAFGFTHHPTRFSRSQSWDVPEAAAALNIDSDKSGDYAAS